MAEETTKEPTKKLQEEFTIQARHFHGYSPLYERLSLGIAGDPELLALVARSPRHNRSLLFLAAVQYLLLQGATHPLAAYYPSLSAGPITDADPYPLFRAFCQEHHDQILSLIMTRHVQTNEVRRCVGLLPAFGQVAQRTGGQPLYLVEIGASAGLNLLWDRYRYRYGKELELGPADSPVLLECEIQGDKTPPVSLDFPQVAARVGIDLSPIDVRDPDQVLWLRALIWPEHRRRVEILEKAVQIAQSDPPRLVAGDAVERLPDVLASCPSESVPCVFHSFMIGQLPRDSRERLFQLLADVAAECPLYHVSFEWPHTEHPQILLTQYEKGEKTETLLAHCNAHGHWIEWLS